VKMLPTPSLEVACSDPPIAAELVVTRPSRPSDRGAERGRSAAFDPASSCVHPVERG